MMTKAGIIENIAVIVTHHTILHHPRRMKQGPLVLTDLFSLGFWTW